MTKRQSTGYNSTFAIDEVSCSEDSFAVPEKVQFFKLEFVHKSTPI